MVSGSVVLRSKYTVPAPAPPRMPPSPSATSSTSCGRGSDVNTTSLAAATAAGLSAQVAPIESSSSAASFRMSNTVISKPPAAIFRAMCRPINPTPINPTFMSASLFIYFSSIYNQFSSLFQPLQEYERLRRMITLVADAIKAETKHKAHTFLTTPRALSIQRNQPPQNPSQHKSI